MFKAFLLAKKVVHGAHGALWIGAHGVDLHGSVFGDLEDLLPDKVGPVLGRVLFLASIKGLPVEGLTFR